MYSVQPVCVCVFNYTHTSPHSILEYHQNKVIRQNYRESRWRGFHWGIVAFSRQFGPLNIQATTFVYFFFLGTKRPLRITLSISLSRPKSQLSERLSLLGAIFKRKATSTDYFVMMSVRYNGWLAESLLLLGVYH